MSNIGLGTSPCGLKIEREWVKDKERGLRIPHTHPKARLPVPAG